MSGAGAAIEQAGTRQQKGTLAKGRHFGPAKVLADEPGHERLVLFQHLGHGTFQGGNKDEVGLVDVVGQQVGANGVATTGYGNGWRKAGQLHPAQGRATGTE